MTVLAFSGAIVNSDSLGRSINTNPVVVRRLLLALRRARLIETFTGKCGGARLNRSASQISLRDIYDAIAPRPAIPISQRKSWKACPVSCQMKEIMSGVSRDAEEALRCHLRRITVQALVRAVAAH